jgi:hypothetical protein
MSYSRRTILVGAAVSFALTTLARAADNGQLGIGHVASPSQIAGWDIDVRADGQGLPPACVRARKFSQRPARPAMVPRVKVNLRIGWLAASARSRRQNPCEPSAAIGPTPALV